MTTIMDGSAVSVSSRLPSRSARGVAQAWLERSFRVERSTSSNLGPPMGEGPRGQGALGLNDSRRPVVPGTASSDARTPIARGDARSPLQRVLAIVHPDSSATRRAPAEPQAELEPEGPGSDSGRPRGPVPARCISRRKTSRDRPLVRSRRARGTPRDASNLVKVGFTGIPRVTGVDAWYRITSWSVLPARGRPPTARSPRVAPGSPRGSA